MPMVSVIMAVFNAEKFVASAIHSVLSQQYRDLELIVVDDGSTDRSLEIIRSIAKEDARLKVLTQANSGRPAPGRNRGLANASGRYISFLDADDYYLSGRIDPLVSALEQHPRWVAAFHDLKYVEKDGEAIAGTYLSDGDFLSKANDYLISVDGDWREYSEKFYVFQSLFYAALHTQSVMIAVDRLPAGTLQFDERFAIVDDTDLWIRLGMCGPMGCLNKVLSCYRQHDTNNTSNKIKFLVDSVLLHTVNYDRIVERLTDDEARTYRHKIARYCHELSYARLLAGQNGEARRSYREAVRWAPGQRFLGRYLKTFLPAPVSNVMRKAVRHLVSGNKRS